mgnify:CR=1 FL=1
MNFIVNRSKGGSTMEWNVFKIGRLGQHRDMDPGPSIGQGLAQGPEWE